jgi:hypothetical protein
MPVPRQEDDTVRILRTRPPGRPAHRPASFRRLSGGDGAEAEVADGDK